jgi:Putative ATP-dependent DNA helicase recG C-terminal
LLRIKAETGSHEARAYPARALRELTVNLLMHRDYRVQEIANINVDPGEKLVFTNPGGLMPEVLAQVNRSPDGKFTPARGITSQRNPILADIFYGLGRMDKAGSGLVDVTKWMREQGGLSEFRSLASNTSVSAALRQAAQEQPGGTTAVPLTTTEVFTTNLLPFLVMPEVLYFIPLKFKRSRQQPLDPELFSKLPIFIYHDNCIITFAEPDLFADYPTGELLFERTRSPSLDDVVSNEDTRRVMVWLLHKHWSFSLRDFLEDGLRVEPKEKRAYFCLQSGSRNEISYTSRLGRRVKRAVVKQRGLPDKLWYENEGIYYHAEDFNGEWALQVKPMYVFTGPDGREPLPPSAQASRATRRFKFDRNKSVDDDLTFWSRYLSRAEPVISIGGLGVDNLILSSTFSEIEVPAATSEEEAE